MKKLLLTTSMIMAATFAHAHGGGLNSEGCHNKTSDGTYHCHRSQTKTKEQRQTSAQQPKEVGIYKGKKLDGVCFIDQSSNANVSGNAVMLTISPLGVKIDDGTVGFVPFGKSNNRGSTASYSNKTVNILRPNKASMNINLKSNVIKVEWKNFFGVNHWATGNCEF